MDRVRMNGGRRETRDTCDHRLICQAWIGWSVRRLERRLIHASGLGCPHSTYVPLVDKRSVADIGDGETSTMSG